MKRALVNFLVCTVLCLVIHSVAAGDKIDVSAVITKSDAEAILGVPVRFPKGRNNEGTDGFYDSEWSYYAITGDKALVFDVLYSPKKVIEAMWSVLPPDRGKPTPVDGLGDKAIFYHDKTGLDMLNILKGNILVTIGINGLPPKTALEQEKSLAQKILAHL